MRKLTKPLSILLSLTLMISMLTIIPAAQASAAEVGSAVGDDPGQKLIYTADGKWGAYDEPTPCILGDADGDGKIGINDATTVQRHLAEYEVSAPVGTQIA